MNESIEYQYDSPVEDEDKEKDASSSQEEKDDLNEFNEFIAQYGKYEIENEEASFIDMLMLEDIRLIFAYFKKTEVFKTVKGSELFKVFRIELSRLYENLSERDKVEGMKASMNSMMKKYKNSLKASYKALTQRLTKQSSFLAKPFEEEAMSNDDSSELQTIKDDYYQKQQSKLDGFLSVESLLSLAIENQIDNLNSLLKDIVLEKTLDTLGSIKYAVLNESLFNKKASTASDLDFGDDKLTNAIKTTVFQKNDNQSATQYFVSNENNKANDIDIIKKSIPNVTELVFNNIPDQTPYFAEVDDKCLNLLKAVYFNNCKCYETVKGSLSKKASVEKFVLRNTRISLAISDSIPDYVKNNCLPPLKVLKIERAELIDIEFNYLFFKIILESSLKNSLTILSFEGNNLASISLPAHSYDVDVVLPKLEELHLKKNKIYSFTLGGKIFPRLKLLDLTKNSIRKAVDLSLPVTKEGYTFLKLPNRNIFMTEKDNINGQKKHLEQILKSFNRKIKSISFAGLYDHKTQDKLLNMKLSPYSFYYLRELDLSFCGLKNNAITEFFENNPKLLQLRRLLLKGNYLDMGFFEYYYMNKNSSSFLSLNNLEYLSLSGNLIKDENFNYVFQYIKSNKNLACINLKYNPFGLNYFVEITNKAIQAEENAELNRAGTTKEKAEIKASRMVAKKQEKDFVKLHKAIQLFNESLFIDFTTANAVISHKTFDRATKQMIIRKRVAKEIE